MSYKRCNNCNSDQVNEDGQCFQCGSGPRVGPPEPRLDSEPKCPKCHSDNFNGWDCKSCGYALTQKTRKAQPAVMSPEEVEAIRKKLGIIK